MFQINDIIMYGNAGVCQITDIRNENFCGKELLYYVLMPVSDKNTKIYCPVHSDQVHIRKLLSAAEIYDLINLMPDSEMEWIENKQIRKEKFNNILHHGNHEELIKMIKLLYFKREERAKEGKKFYQYDDKMMKDAEKILYGEFAHVLHIEPDDVVPFIMGRLEQKTKAETGA